MFLKNKIVFKFLIFYFFTIKSAQNDADIQRQISELNKSLNSYKVGSIFLAGVLVLSLVNQLRQYIENERSKKCLDKCNEQTNILQKKIDKLEIILNSTLGNIYEERSNLKKKIEEIEEINKNCSIIYKKVLEDIKNINICLTKKELDYIQTKTIKINNEIAKAKVDTDFILIKMSEITSDLKNIENETLEKIKKLLDNGNNEIEKKTKNIIFEFINKKESFIKEFDSIFSNQLKLIKLSIDKEVDKKIIEKLHNYQELLNNYKDLKLSLDEIKSKLS